MANVYIVVCVFCLSFCTFTVFIVHAESYCSLIIAEAREPCPSSLPDYSWTANECLSVGCCWDDEANSSDLKCYRNGCKLGYFGWGCKFKCQCQNGQSCDSLTGQCDSGCRPDSWGVGCLLDNECTYNDPEGVNYMGKHSRTVSNKTCAPWTKFRSYGDRSFPDGSRRAAANYCRNPKRSKFKSWCFLDQRKPEDCALRESACPSGLFAANCTKQCHCRDFNESCSQNYGLCQSGCHVHWAGVGCQECANGYFGQLCQYSCRCSNATEICDKSSGVCQSGCTPGWTGDGCQTECANGTFGINCESSCNCKNDGEACNKTNGDCASGCKPGYAGSGCEIQLPTMTRAPEVEVRNATSVTLKWDKWSSGNGMGPVNSYVLRYRERDDGTWNDMPETSERKLAVTDLVSEQVYHFCVAAIHEKGHVGPCSPSTSVATCGRPLSGPRTLKLHVDSEEDEEYSDVEDLPAADENISVVVTWELPSNEESNCAGFQRFNMYTSVTGDLEYVKSGAIATEVSLPRVDPYSNFTIGISLFNSAGLESDVQIIHYIGKSSAVSNLVISATSSTSLQVHWSPPEASNAAIDFYLSSYRKLHPVSCPFEAQDWSPLVDVDADKMDLEFTELMPYCRYELKVWPQTVAGLGRVAVIFGITDAAAPSEVDQFELVKLTSTTAQLSWGELKCQQWNGEFVGYTYDLSQYVLPEEHPTAVEHRQINSTFVDLDSLIPFTSYFIQVWFSNHKYAGPRTALNFTTLEDVPPAPLNVTLQSQLSHSLVISWLPPYPPHGIITGYSIKFQQQTFSLPSLKLTYNASGLEPNTLYSIQVRARTSVGDGPWSDVLKAITDESIPSEPRNFVNVSRNATSVTFEWNVPLMPNGILQDYKLACTPATTHSKSVAHGMDITIHPTLTRYTLSGLLPGTCYVCTLKASTKKGFGMHASKVVWMEPHITVVVPEPKIDSAKSTNVTLVVMLKSPGPIVNMEEVDSLYRTVVERLTHRSTIKRQSSDSPCRMSHSDLRDFYNAQKHGHDCYIAAEFPFIEQEKTFIVGDNKTYGGFYNAPLVPGKPYRVWLGLFVTVDGVTASSYVASAASYDDVPSVTDPLPVQTENENTAAMAGAAVGAILAVVIIIVAVVFICYKSGMVPRHVRRSTDSECRNFKSSLEMSDPADTISKFRDEKGLLSVRNSEDVDEVSEGRAETLPLCSRSTSSAHRPIPVDDLWPYVARKKMANDGGLKAEYEEISQGLQYKYDTARRMENKLKNRYANIVAYDHSRVILDGYEDGNTNYINANYIDGFMKPDAFVATQGPSKHTMNDMWFMVWQLKCSRIVMVSNLTEDGRHKCEQYWPETGSKQFGDIVVDFVDIEHYADFKIRTFTLTRGDTKTTVRQFHFTAWPDHGVPSYPTSLLAFHKKFRSYQDSSAGPAIVHCSAGVGRTGTFIALDYLLDQAKVEGRVDVFNCVQQMRSKRVNMVQTVEQYIFVYDALLEALKCGDTSIPCMEFRSRYTELQKINPQSGKSFCLDEFNLLASVTQLADVDRSKIDGLEDDNLKKNRTLDILPVNKFSRPYLLTYIAGSTDYINAVFVDGYKQRDAFIVTQAPLTNTVIDFWTMIYDHSCRTIVMMNDIDPLDKTLGNYFPLTSGSQTHGPFTVELVTMDSSNPHIVTRDLIITFNKRGTNSEPMFIRHFQLVSWPSHQPLPTKAAMLALLNMLEKWQQRSGNGTITVHCMDGATRCGLVCALSYVVERLKVEQDVDVFQSVKHARTNRSQIVPTFEQYQYLYDMAVEYMDCFETYANFK